MRFFIAVTLGWLALGHVGGHVGAWAASPPIDVKRLEGCLGVADALKPGHPEYPISRIEPIGKRRGYQVFAKKTRYYVFFAERACHVFPVVGRPHSFAKGRFTGAPADDTAYAIETPYKTDAGTSEYVLSLKAADDRFVDAMLLTERCNYGVRLERLRLFADHDSLRVGCHWSAGADGSETVFVVDYRDGELRILHEALLGIAWVQVGTSPLCTARHVGSVDVATVGDQRVLRIVTALTDEQVKSIPPDKWESGGCSGYGARADWTYDAAKRKLVRASPDRIIRRDNLCTGCKRP